MRNLRPLVALCASLSLLLSGGLAFALGTAQADHDRDHLQAGVMAAHESADHEHGTLQTELFSKLCGLGFDQLTSSCAVSHVASLLQDAPAAAAVVFQPLPEVLVSLPIPGPPPRLAALHRGGGAAS